MKYVQGGKSHSLLFGAAIIFASVVALAAFTGYSWITRTTQEEVRNLIADHLTVGATTDEIYTFLDERGIRHGYTQTSDGIDTQLKEAGYGQGVRFIPAWIEDASFCWIHTTDILIYFILNEDDRLETYFTTEICKGGF